MRIPAFVIALVLLAAGVVFFVKSAPSKTRARCEWLRAEILQDTVYRAAMMRQVAWNGSVAVDLAHGRQASCPGSYGRYIAQARIEPADLELECPGHGTLGWRSPRIDQLFREHGLAADRYTVERRDVRKDGTLGPSHAEEVTFPRIPPLEGVQSPGAPTPATHGAAEPAPAGRSCGKPRAPGPHVLS